MAKTPRAVHVLTALLLLSGGLTGALATGPVGRWWLLAPLAAALVVGESLQDEFAYGRDVSAVDVFEAVMAAVLLLFAGPAAVLLAVLSTAVSRPGVVLARHNAGADGHPARPGGGRASVR